jgi:hypothetical protein
MSETKHEIAQIREITREVGRFGGIMRILYVAERTTHEGTETIAMSKEFEWQKDKNLSEQELEQATRKLHNLVLQSLLSDGWEPIGTDEKGRVMALNQPSQTTISHGALQLPGAENKRPHLLKSPERYQQFPLQFQY